MYKWHVHSAIGRGRPRIGDFAKLADGIAASLRQFHVSQSRQAEDEGAGKPSQLSRAQRSVAAAAEISSLSAGGIDARSLAATPPQRFTIRRVDHQPTGRGAFRRTGSNMGGISRGRGGMLGRGGIRGRGGGRGGQGGRGRATRRRGVRRRGQITESSGYAENSAPLTAEEQAYVDSIQMGVPTPARVGITDLETLKREAPGIATNTAPIGFVSTIRDHMKILTGQHGDEYLTSEQHAKRYFMGNGTLFVDEEDKARAVGPDRFPGAPKKYDTLDKVDREAILKTLVGGHYQPINPMVNGNTLTIIDSYIRRNETYLPKDAAALMAGVQKILPSQNAAKRVNQATKQ